MREVEYKFKTQEREISSLLFEDSYLRKKRNNVYFSLEFRMFHILKH